ncbi:tRNA uridine-5-carboxymethylaminomethyl(34) synthesis GTPase MnmE [Candidatus Bipolaricaulota bacterium]|nr:tRNA uridine-5-carboxymethylaminomethyl(34) synthesis GTPase MnmE [Candidatus Bipolaricaulota bacterium]
MIDDTIAAISTPIGDGGIGIVRLSGSDAMLIADALFRSPTRVPLVDADSHTLHYGAIHVEGRLIDEVLVSVMRAPRTYTREDVVEINCHGGIVSTRAILDATLAAGARMAERGEFTKRAFVNGRISLDQAKAVLDVVRARTALGLEAAVDRLGGRFTHALADLRAKLADILADLEVEIDYPDLDVDIEAIAPRIEDCSTSVQELLSKSESGRLIREGLTVAIVGRPNVGKSTLLNALLSEERAIVTPIPGTTRDTIEEDASLGGIPVRWIDTAGLRDADHPVEAEGVRRTRGAMDRADLLLLLVDASEPRHREDDAVLNLDRSVPSLLILNKSDLPTAWDDVPKGTWLATLRVSAKHGVGIEALREEILSAVGAGTLPTRNSVLLLDTWERDLLRRVGERLIQASQTAREGGQADMMAEELRLAYQTASELQGIDISESILDAVFAKFCVGK